ncbi:hypothetical protein BH18ACT9_BH18ACT9_09050 [soil metagenome]
MSALLSGRSVLRRAVVLLSAGAVVAGGLGAVPAATAAGDQDGLRPMKISRPPMEPGRYVVMLRAPSATGYRGGQPGLAPTGVAPDASFDGDRAVVKEYTSYLRAQQSKLARSVGASIQEHYTIGSNGFTARLSGKQASLLAADKDVLVVAKDEARKADTWNTPDFLGLTGKDGVWNRYAGGRNKAGQGTVVGVIDSGIWPESKSFRGGRLTSTPKTKWDIKRVRENVSMRKADGGRFTGACELEHDGVVAEQWNADDCNTKLIGARFYPDAFLASVDQENWSPTEVISTRDGGGHGSHTASTAAGKTVDDVEVEGTSFGTVSGMAPGARIAAYKVCFDDDDPTTGGCYTSSIMAAIDDSINDGVDVINFSISGAVDTVIDPVELAFEGAAEAGIFVAVSAGNSGPDRSTVAHNSPWLTTVAASTHVNFENTVVLGNGNKYKGASISSTPLPQTPLVESTAVAKAGAVPAEANLCYLGTLDPAKVAGKIVLCTRGVIDRVEKSQEVKNAGGVGMILANPSENSLAADFHAVPTIHIDHVAGAEVRAYIAAQGAAATAAFVLGDQTGGEPTPLPQIAGFSSRGAALANGGDLLKPDIAAPGSSVLAAVAPPSNSNRRYDLYSGTSMASPHIAGLANFMMGVHPNWSPMKVKSAMMTTARSLRTANGGVSRDVLAQGAGHITPRKFFNPGLFVTAGANQWRRFIQGQGLDIGYRPLQAKKLNVPSMADNDVVGSTSFKRTFTPAVSGTWRVSVDVPGFRASAPGKVTFRKGVDKAVRFGFTRTTARFNRWAKGYVTLTGPTRVRMPVALRPVALAVDPEVAGDGVTGSVDVSVTAATTGEIDIIPNGLTESQVEEGAVPVGDFDSYCASVSANSLVARFDLDALEDAADLDLYAYPATAGCAAVDFDTEYASATGAADEQVTIPDPEATAYAVFVDGYAGPDETVEYRLDLFDVPPGPGVGNLTADPDPLPVVSGVETSYEASWSGLDADARYMGVFEYAGFNNIETYLTVDTRP